MSVTTGLWIWGFRITTSNQSLPFDRGGNLDATLRLGDYTAGQFATEVARAMNAADSGQTYTCEFNFDTRAFTLDNGATAFALEFSRSSTDCGGLLGFDPAADTASLSSGHTGVAAGTSYSLTAGVKVWAPTDPAVSNSPVTAGADTTGASLLQRKVRAIQHETDGGLRETIYFSTDKRFRIEYRYLSASEQTNFEALLDWIVTGAPVDFRPDDTAAATINMRLVLDNPGEIANSFSWQSLANADYPTLVFVEQLNRT